MFSLRVAILFALSTQFICYSVYGYVVVPNSSANDPSLSTDEETPCSGDTDVEETPSVPNIYTQTAPVYSSSYVAVQQNQTKRGGYPCNPDNGCYIRHFRQYNYYYPNGQRVNPNTVPVQSQSTYSNDGLSVSSSIQTTNDNGKVTVQTSNSKPTVRYNLPGVTSYVPNNGFNYVYSQLFDSGLRQGVQAQAQAQAQSYATASTYDQRPVSEEEQVLSEELSEEQTTEAPQSDDSCTETNSSENEDKDTTTYITGPNMYGQSKVRVSNNGNSRNFQSQYVSVYQSGPQTRPIVEQEQEEVQTTSKLLPTSSISYGNVGNSQIFQSQQSSVSSGIEPKTVAPKEEVISILPSPVPATPTTILPAYGPGITWPSYVPKSRLTYGFNPYYQIHQFGVSTLPPTPAPLPAQVPVSVPVAGVPVRSSVYGPNNFQFLNPVNAWANYAVQSPLYDITNVAPSYSVVL